MHVTDAALKLGRPTLLLSHYSFSCQLEAYLLLWRAFFPFILNLWMSQCGGCLEDIPEIPMFSLLFLLNPNFFTRSPSSVALA